MWDGDIRDIKGLEQRTDWMNHLDFTQKTTKWRVWRHKKLFALQRVHMAWRVTWNTRDQKKSNKGKDGLEGEMGGCELRYEIVAISAPTLRGHARHSTKPKNWVRYIGSVDVPLV